MPGNYQQRRKKVKGGLIVEELAEPGEEGGAPGAGFGRTFGVGDAETMAAGLATVEGVRDVVRREGGVQEKAVAEIDDVVILAGNEEDRRAIRTDMALDREGVAESLVPLIPDAEGAASRPFVDQRSRNGQWTMDNGQ